MDKSTKKPLLVNGKEVAVSKEFTAEKSNGEVELEFTFDATKLGTKSIVAFEELYQFVAKGTGTDSSKEEHLIAVHKDIDDADQTVHFTLNPETGDNRHVMVWVTLFIGSFGALCGLYLFKKKE